MEPTIEMFDWARIFLGEAPPLFFLEIIFRTLVIYTYTLVLLRWLGSRALSQLSNLEFLLVIALGSAVGDAMFYPDVPLLHSLAVVTLVVLANKALDILMARRQSVERALDGIPEEAVNAGVICLRFLQGTTFSRSELFQQLREQGIEHLGQVEHAYVETDGVLTVFKSKNKDKPGLSIVPPWEIAPPLELTMEERGGAGAMACMSCGTIATPEGRAEGCWYCGHSKWTVAQEEASSTRSLEKHLS